MAITDQSCVTAAVDGQEGPESAVSALDDKPSRAADAEHVSVEWDQLRNNVLRQRGAALLGPSTATNGEPALTFTAKYMPTGEISVTVGETCDLSDVHDLSLRIARACLNTDADVVFARKLEEKS